jgi:hypothetical protein
MYAPPVVAGNDPSPVPRRLENTPLRDTLSPRERAEFSRRFLDSTPFSLAK